ncbi:MAG: hypothetical protein HYX47_21645 [Burkholderiales bacterium]|nr:hypothetical protein [Burkholderiales bacterium]
MIRPTPSSPAPTSHSASAAAHEFIAVLDRYSANFDLMVSAWKTRDIYDVVTDEFSALMQLQKASFPEAAVVMIDVVLAHNDVAIALLDLHRFRNQRGLARFTEKDLSDRQARHALAVTALRSYILKKTH